MKLSIGKLLATNLFFTKTYYWGQNSVFYLNPTASSFQEKRLGYYCDLDWVDNIALSFVNKFPDASGYLGMNHAYHCWTTFPNTPLLNCPQIEADIVYCQQKGKKIGISLGGAIGEYGFTSDLEADNFAYTLWNLFFEGASVYRPYGNAVLDFVDFNIEGGSSIGYHTLSKTLKSLMNAGSKNYFISAAPQCVYPDRYIGPGNGLLLSTNDTNYVDHVYIQFYNNDCGLQNYPNRFNYNVWNTWAMNLNTSLFIGFPSHPLSVGIGYVNLGNLSTILSDTFSSFPSTFRGIMGWDIGFAEVDNYGSDVNLALNSLVATPTQTLTQTLTPTQTCTDATITSTSTVTTTSTQIVPTRITTTITRTSTKIVPTRITTTTTVSRTKTIKQPPVTRTITRTSTVTRTMTRTATVTRTMTRF